MRKLQQWNEALGRVEKFLVVVMLSVMILMAFLQIVLRNAFSSGISWGDPLVRYLVLWVGFIGASLATKEEKHITIEVFSLWFSGNKAFYLKLLSQMVSATICGLLTFAGWTFVQNEARMGGGALLKIPTWIPQMIIPITFALMTLRFLINFTAQLSIILKSNNYSAHGNKA
jgi:TRAP-type C4-dicarboxylate transport system permease small subunit